ncbi:acyl-CoA reductase-like NAD-dependent aldehyde dehydrogenase [Amycolatopsis sulphurea]|uniref:Acyl-CoA reductase-like NAD-dependent aldehyde dehydrogenase n=1 Tax=Amycolatopsis sulphurea TaxID=76022 RepID=A0A2A9FGT5_9PSEU|nr:aldehyde dehydrogenase family protein [Amycolatopsis sulphurea]PFG49639.1 acyl-CoA reductase-like NAD-dependent aldehyde dehydrogenase [Amycolatopsis sulphurea]
MTHPISGTTTKGTTHPVLNPATGEVVASVEVLDGAAVDAAVLAAQKAFEAWRDTSIEQRVEVLDRIADIVHGNAGKLSELLTLEQGKPIAESRMEVDTTEATFRRYADLGREKGAALFAENLGEHVRTFTPLGVVAGIIPWNAPLIVAAMKAGPAILTGNTIILKPAPTTPLATLELSRLLADAVPEGLVQCLVDDGSIGPLLASHPGVRKVAFTGSTVNGRNVTAAGASTLKRLTLELGGNDPAIVLGDADPGTAAAGIFARAFLNAGQVCGAVKRVYVHDDVYDRFVEAIADLVRDVVVGDGFDPAVTVGPLQNRIQHEKATALLAEAARDGTILAQSGVPDVDGGYFVPVTVVGDLDDAHPLVAGEQFAPILPLLRFSDEADAVARANSTEYGLTASVWTSDVAHGESVVQRIDAALLCVNKHNRVDPALGIAMSKQSGTGWLFGPEGVREYLQPHLLFR